MTTNSIDIGIFSLFAGIGFLDLGFEMNGVTIDFVNELDPSLLAGYKHSREVLGLNLPKFGFYEGDMNNLLKKDAGIFTESVTKAKSIHKYIGFIGGSPCPDFSVAGKNRGSRGKNGKLTKSFANLICKHQPDFFLFENVKGLWRTAKHKRYFQKLKKYYSDAGYVLTEKLINAIEYGAPQDRERIILLGFRKSLVKTLGYKFDPKSMQLSDTSFPWNEKIKFQKNNSFMRPWPQVNPFIEDDDTSPPNGIIKELTVEYWFNKNKVETHPNAKHCFNPKSVTRFQSIPEGDVSKKSFKRLHRWRYSPTACYGNNEVHLHPYKSRRISVAEALAIQSLPRKFSLPESMTLSQMFKAVGNGVPFLASHSLANSIRDFLYA